MLKLEQELNILFLKNGQPARCHCFESFICLVEFTPPWSPVREALSLRASYREELKLQNGQVSLKGHRAQEAVEQDFNSDQLWTITVPRAETDCVEVVETVKEQAQENVSSKQEVESRKLHMGRWTQRAAAKPSFTRGASGVWLPLLTFANSYKTKLFTK